MKAVTGFGSISLDSLASLLRHAFVILNNSADTRQLTDVIDAKLNFLVIRYGDLQYSVSMCPIKKSQNSDPLFVVDNQEGTFGVYARENLRKLLYVLTLLKSTCPEERVYTEAPKVHRLAPEHAVLHAEGWQFEITLSQEGEFSDCLYIMKQLLDRYGYDRIMARATPRITSLIAQLLLIESRQFPSLERLELA